jgi:rhodanese-related sulfurtransferase
MQQLSPQALRTWLDDSARPAPLLVDVREPWEVEICAIANSKSIPMQSIPVRASEIDRDAEVVVICHHGGRSMQVGLFLERHGYAKVFNLSGGVDGWAKAVDPSMATY